MQTPLDVPLISLGVRFDGLGAGTTVAQVSMRPLFTLPAKMVEWGIPFQSILSFRPTWASWCAAQIGNPRVARDGCGQLAQNTVSELALCFDYLARTKDQDWIWEAMVDIQIWSAV